MSRGDTAGVAAEALATVQAVQAATEANTYSDGVEAAPSTLSREDAATAGLAAVAIT